MLLRSIRRRPPILGITVVILLWTGFYLVSQNSETMPQEKDPAEEYSDTKLPHLTAENYSYETIDCEPNVPCVYPEEVDFRVIVLTFDRAKSLQRLLETLDTVELDGDSGRLEIWIDRDKNNKVHTETLEAALRFNWMHGPTRVHVRKVHVGLYGQWIDTWTPHDTSKDSKEIAVILEDDLLVSPFIYRWLKAVHRHYRSKPEFFAATLVSDEPLGKEARRPHMINHKNHTVYYHKYPDTWGLSPSPYHWHLFQEWFHRIYYSRSDFKPYVDGTVFTEWYQIFEKSGTTKNMWSMWVIYYSNSQQMFTLYNNLPLYTNATTNCLTINKREPGLHFTKKSLPKPYCSLLTEWKDEYVAFPKETLKVDWNGKLLQHYF